jgi:hypothetical protein
LHPYSADKATLSVLNRLANQHYLQGGIMKIFVLTILFCCFFSPGTGYCDELTLEKQMAIKELLQVTGATQLGELMGNAVAQQMGQTWKQTKPDIDPRAFDIITDEIKALIHEEFVVKESLFPFLYPIYHKYLTLEETNELIRFYKTPIGRKAIHVMPKMTQESMQAGQTWVLTIIPKYQQRVLDRFEKAGIKIDE